MWLCTWLHFIIEKKTFFFLFVFSFGDVWKKLHLKNHNCSITKCLKSIISHCGLRIVMISYREPSGDSHPYRAIFFVVLVNNNNTVAHVWVIKCSLLHPGVAPFSGATTGTGGRIRDVQSAGKGGHVIAGTAGYCFGNLHIPGKLLIHLFCFKNEPLPLSWIVPFKLSSPFFFFFSYFVLWAHFNIPGSSLFSGFVLPWEEEGWEYPSSFAPPLQVAIEASDGASDYGNKFGEPVLAGEI